MSEDERMKQWRANTLPVKSAERLKGRSSRSTCSARPIGCPPEVWEAVLEVRHAQIRLEDDYPAWNPSGQKHAVLEAAQSLRIAHKNLMHYVGNISID